MVVAGELYPSAAYPNWPMNPNDIKRLKAAIQRNANQTQAIKYVLQDVIRKLPSSRQLDQWENTLDSITPLNLNEFLDEQPTKKGR